MTRIRIENAAPGGPVRRIIVGGVVYDVSECTPLAEGMVEVYKVDYHQGTPPTAARLAEIHSNHEFERKMLHVERSEDYATQASVDRGDLLAAYDGVMKIVSDWCIEYNNSGGIDAGDLAWRLEEAGHLFADDDDE
jgi:hypothetical protein